MPSEACLENIRKKGGQYCEGNLCAVLQEDIDTYCEHVGLPCNSPVPQRDQGGLCYCCCCPTPKTCLENIMEKNPPRPCSPEHCEEKRPEINEYCALLGLGCNMPVPQEDDQGKCWCCCSCATADTPIAVAGGYRLIETIGAGDKVLATGGRMAGWVERAVSEIGDLPAGAPRDAFFAARFRLADGEERTMTVMADQLYLLPSGMLKPIADLRPGEEVAQANGSRAVLVSLARDNFSGGVRTVTLGAFDPTANRDDPYRGHLIDMFGLVTADFAVQTAYYAAELPAAANHGKVTEGKDEQC